MRTYGKGARLFCDFHFSGKPKAICLEVIEPGQGNQITQGKIKVQLTETVGGYKRGEILELTASTAVPLEQKFSKHGSPFIWVNTDYAWK